MNMIASDFESVSPLYRVRSALRTRPRSVRTGMALAVASISLFGLLNLSQVLSGSSLLNTALVAKAAAQAHPSLSAAPAATPPSVPAVVAPAADPRTCTPDSTYAVPSQLDLTGNADGLTQVTDSPSYYAVYGSTAAQVRNQVKQCAPNSGSAAGGGDEFAAETGYRLSWQYDTTTDAAGTCSVNSVKIGLHLNMVLPSWQPTPTASRSQATAWQKYISNLTIHENGHVAIDRQYASQLLGDLQTYPASDCATLTAGVQSKVNADIAALTAANDAYDARTNHGATQGAILP